MKKLSKILSLVLAVVMVLALAVPAGAFQTNVTAAFTDWAKLGENRKEAVDVLRELDIITGVSVPGSEQTLIDPQGTFTRAQAAALTAYAYAGSTVVNKLTAPTTAPFKDVPVSHWASKFIAYVSQAGLIVGDGKGGFNPDKPVTDVEFGILMLKVVGYLAHDELTPGNWQYEGLTQGLNRGILVKGLDKDYNEAAIREDVFQYLFNALTVRTVTYSEFINDYVDRVNTFDPGSKLNPTLGEKNFGLTYDDTLPQAAYGYRAVIWLRNGKAITGQYKRGTVLAPNAKGYTSTDGVPIETYKDSAGNDVLGLTTEGQNAKYKASLDSVVDYYWNGEKLYLDTSVQSQQSKWDKSTPKKDFKNYDEYKVFVDGLVKATYDRYISSSAVYDPSSTTTADLFLSLAIVDLQLAGGNLIAARDIVNEVINKYNVLYNTVDGTQGHYLTAITTISTANAALTPSDISSAIARIRTAIDQARIAVNGAIGATINPTPPSTIFTGVIDDGTGKIAAYTASGALTANDVYAAITTALKYEYDKDNFFKSADRTHYDAAGKKGVIVNLVDDNGNGKADRVIIIEKEVLRLTGAPVSNITNGISIPGVTQAAIALDEIVYDADLVKGDVVLYHKDNAGVHHVEKAASSAGTMTGYSNRDRTITFASTTYVNSQLNWAIDSKNPEKVLPYDDQLIPFTTEKGNYNVNGTAWFDDNNGIARLILDEGAEPDYIIPLEFRGGHLGLPNGGSYTFTVEARVLKTDGTTENIRVKEISGNGKTYDAAYFDYRNEDFTGLIYSYTIDSNGEYSITLLHNNTIDTADHLYKLALFTDAKTNNDTLPRNVINTSLVSTTQQVTNVVSSDATTNLMPQVSKTQAQADLENAATPKPQPPAKADLGINIVGDDNTVFLVAVRKNDIVTSADVYKGVKNAPTYDKDHTPAGYVVIGKDGYADVVYLVTDAVDASPTLNYIYFVNPAGDFDYDGTKMVNKVGDNYRVLAIKPGDTTASWVLVSSKAWDQVRKDNEYELTKTNYPADESTYLYNIGWKDDVITAVEAVDYYGRKPLTNDTNRFWYSFATGLGTNFDEKGVIKLGLGEQQVTYNFNSNSKVYFIAKINGENTYHFSQVSPEAQNVAGSMMTNTSYVYTVQLVNNSSIGDLIDTLYVIQTYPNEVSGTPVAQARLSLRTSIQNLKNWLVGKYTDDNSSGEYDKGDTFDALYTGATAKNILDALKLVQSSYPTVKEKIDAVNHAYRGNILLTDATAEAAAVDTKITAASHTPAAVLSAPSTYADWISDDPYDYGATVTASDLITWGIQLPLTSIDWATLDTTINGTAYSIEWQKPVLTDAAPVSGSALSITADAVNTNATTRAYTVANAAAGDTIEISYVATLSDGTTIKGTLTYTVS